MKKLNTSGCLFSKSERNKGSRNKMANTIFKNVSTINRLKMSFLPEENL
ncbi:hypothetical protein WPG_1375 [Winogradskyella sp. PG-2]|nr:hypothetical protein WPG_1375 [Winogradskyella sp. PG-2]